MNDFWWDVLKVVPGIVFGAIGAVTGGMALYFNRRDAKRVAAASAPTATLLLNPHAEADSWCVMKLTFERVSRSFVITSATILMPSSALIAGRQRSGVAGKQERAGDGARTIAVNWRLDPQLGPQTAAGFAHLNLKVANGQKPTMARLKLTGHYVSGLQEPVTIECVGRAK